MIPALEVQPLQTPVFHAGESLSEFIAAHVPQGCVGESMILAVTSKIVSLAENRIVANDSISKAELIAREADVNFGEAGYGCYLTVKHGLFIPSAGIDESNSESGGYILFPEDPFASAAKLWSHLRAEWKLDKLGILITDSHTTPLRKGVTGISLAHWGFEGVRSMIGTDDLFGRKLQMTNINIADALSASAVLMMGEGNEGRPLAVIRGADVQFTKSTSPEEVRMSRELDLYFPFFSKTFSEK